MERGVTRRALLRVGATTVALGIAGCPGSSSEGQWDIEGTLAVTNARQFSSPGCSCCGQYASYLREYLDTTLGGTETEDVTALKRRHGIPAELQSCHALVLDEYVVLEAETRGVPNPVRHVEHGSPVEVLLDAVESNDSHAVVTGTTGRRGSDRILLGSVAEKTVHSAPVPVVTVGRWGQQY